VRRLKETGVIFYDFLKMLLHWLTNSHWNAFYLFISLRHFETLN